MIETQLQPRSVIVECSKWKSVISNASLQYVTEKMLLCQNVDSPIVTPFTYALWEKDFSYPSDLDLIIKYDKNLGPIYGSTAQSILKNPVLCRIWIEQIGKTWIRILMLKSLARITSSIPYYWSFTLDLNDYRSNISNQGSFPKKDLGVVLYSRKRSLYSIRKEMPCRWIFLFKKTGNSC